MRMKFILLVLVQVLVLVGMMGYRYYWVSTGKRVVLKTAPVDPRSLFRGDYARLSYDISTIEFEEPDTAPRFHRNERVYVELHRNEDGTWSAGEVHKKRPRNWPFIQGRVKYYYLHSPRKIVTLRDNAGEVHVLKPSWLAMKKGNHAAFCVNDNGAVLLQYDLDQNVIPKRWCNNGSVMTGTIEDVKTEDTARLQLTYGIESYFVEEGTGHKVEQQGRAGKVLVEVALLGNGQATISRLILKNPGPQSSGRM